MGKHAVGKWGRGEGLEVMSAKKRAQIGKAPKGNAFYRGVAKFWCFLCNDEHRRVDCPKVEEVE